MNKENAIELCNESLWHDFLSIMPPEWEKIAQEMNVMKGAKHDKDIVNAMRVLFIHLGTGASLKETVAYAKAAGICNISSVALFHRLIKFGPFFEKLCKNIMTENVIACCKNDDRLLVVDASDIKEPGPTGSHYRCHYCVSLYDFSCNHMELTSVVGKGTGETLCRYPVTSGDHFIADRGYSHSKGIAHVHNNGGFVLIRVNHSALPLFTEDGTSFPLLNNLNTLTSTGNAGAWPCCIKDVETGRLIKGRICAIRKNAEAISESLSKAKEDARRKFKKITDKTLRLCEYTVLFTTYDLKKYPLKKILSIYRWRWQIELVFKRFKSLLALGCLPKTTDQSSRAWLHGKLLLALLIERICHQQRAFSPWRKLAKDSIEQQRQLVEAF